MDLQSLIFAAKWESDAIFNFYLILISLCNTWGSLMDAAAAGDCLVYSFGVGKDASFENSMADLGCRKGCQVSDLLLHTTAVSIDDTW